MKKGERRQRKLLEMVRRDGAVSVVELAERLGVSYMTIKRDTGELEERRLLEVINGVAVHNRDLAFDPDGAYSLARAGAAMTEEKDRIGMKAAALIDDNDTIIVDSGSTTEFMVRHLPDDIRVNILCYCMNVLAEVYKRDNCRLIFAGGYFHKNSLMFESPEGISLIKRTRAAKAFVTASGVNAELGVTSDNHYEAPVKRAIIESSQKRILLADSSKFGLVRSSYFADLSEFDAIVTDSAPPREFSKALKTAGGELLLA
ncbi:MAG: DeoR/GlpR family DNA-binding transcription regulator [Planctomycetota bacterium]|jgi:DeoR family deoxyribose operon repressor|nr:DeoR/GlpR family DNA-binding transcription regulator [Planctomycetota bacterium]